MEDFKIGDLVVPLFEENKRVRKVTSVGKSLEVEIDDGWEISAKCNYRKASNDEIEELYNV
ncbi:hypothetical protein HMPREF3291_05150 [Bacillus sp. HMSC76G11]|nr:hypothetical protein HMPREF3291_05150 [Bacillus sp. HMSC76G11]